MNKKALALTKIFLVVSVHLFLTGFMWAMMVLCGDTEKMENINALMWSVWTLFLLYSGMASAMPMITVIVNSFEKEEKDASPASN